MAFKKITSKIHLWLGLTSGLVVFIVGITGCCYVFINEIQRVTQPWQFAKEEHKVYLLPSQIKTIVEKKMQGRQVSFVNYQPGRTTYAGVFGKDYRFGVYINPYSGTIQHISNFNDNKFDFFSFVLHGHRALWLPYNIGRPAVDACILMFLILIISGFILWWPKNLKKSNVDKSFKIKWTATFKRLNYDLHNVLGFYVLLIAFAFAVTGLVWGYDWFAKSVYWVTSVGNVKPEYKQPVSDTTSNLQYRATVTDSLWLVHTHNKQAMSSSVSFPKEKKDVIVITANHRPETNYRNDIYIYDQYTLKPLTRGDSFSGSYADASVADRIARMNYDIHTGQIGGLPTKILAFFGSLICASLPITGFYIWWGKKKKKRKKPRKLAATIQWHNEAATL